MRGVCTGKDLGGGAPWGRARREQVEGGASTLAHLGHAEAAAVAPLALQEVDLARQTPTRSRRAWLQMMTLIAIEIKPYIKYASI